MEVDWITKGEQYKDLLRQAEHDSLVQIVLSQQPNHPSLLRRIIGSVSRLRMQWSQPKVAPQEFSSMLDTARYQPVCDALCA